MQTRHILPLTGIRFFAALWIVLYHFPMAGALFAPLRVLYPLTQLGYEAVPFFFMLSGFILSHNYFSNYSIASHPKFIFLRFARLWPVHCVTLLLSASLLSWPFARVQELFMVRLWFDNQVGWNNPAWSVSAEWFAYIFVFPFCFLLFKRIRSVPWLVVIVLLCLTAQATPFRTWVLPSTNLWGSIFFLFLAGSALYQLRTVSKSESPEAITIGGVFFMLEYVFFHEQLSVFILYFSFAMIIYGLSYQRGMISRLLSKKIIVQGGLASYSLYMTHFLVIQAFISYTWPYWKTLQNSVLACGALFVVAIAAMVAMTAIFYRYVEVPANRKLRAAWDRLGGRAVSQKTSLNTLPAPSTGSPVEAKGV